MKYYLVVKGGDGNYVMTFDTTDKLNSSIVELINEGFEESENALGTYYNGRKQKHYAVVQGIQITTVVNSVEVK